MKKVGSFIWWTTQRNPDHVSRDFYAQGVRGSVAIDLEKETYTDELPHEDYLKAVVAFYKKHGRYTGDPVDQIGISEAFEE